MNAGYSDVSETQELEDIREFESEDKVIEKEIENKEDEKIDPVDKKELEKIRQKLKKQQQTANEKKKEEKRELQKQKKELQAKAEKAEKEHKAEKAVLYYLELEKLFPENSYYCYRLGVLYYSLKDMSLSENYLKKALQKNPQDIKPRLKLASVYYEQKKYFAAEKQLQLVLQQSPDNLQAHLLLARIYTDLQEDEKAQKHFQKVLDKNPKDLSVMLPYARLHFRNRNYREAKTYYEGSLGLSDKASQKAIEEKLISIRPHIRPSLAYDISYSREREKDLVSKIKTTQLEIFNNSVKMAFPVSNSFRPYFFFGYFFEKQHNLIDRVNNYNTNNYLYSLGGEFFCHKYFTAKLELAVRQAENSRNNIFNFHDTNHFEPLLALRFCTPRYLVFLSGRIDGEIARDFDDYYSYLVRKQNVLGIFEYRFYPPLCSVGTEIKETFYSNPIFNRKDRFSLWGRAGINLFTCDWMLQYQYDRESFHKTISDYSTFKKENSQWLRMLFFKKWQPNRELEVSYEHLWRKTKDLTNEATIITYGSIPEVLKSNDYEADIVNCSFKVVIYQKLHFKLSATAYTDTDDYNILLGGLHLMQVF